MTNLTKANSRAAEIRASLESAEADLAPARERLGIAIADGDESAAKSARAEIARLERLHTELSAALPIAERRVSEAQAAEREEQRRIAEKAANKNRAKRVAQAKKVDAAMAALGRAYEELLALDTGGDLDGTNRAHVIRRKRYSARGAFALHAPTLSRVLEVPVIPNAHRRPLAESESGLIQEFVVEPETEAEPA